MRAGSWVIIFFLREKIFANYIYSRMKGITFRIVEIIIYPSYYSEGFLVVPPTSEQKFFFQHLNHVKNPSYWKTSSLPQESFAVCGIRDQMSKCPLAI